MDFEVTLAKPCKVQDYDLWDEKPYYRIQDNTTAVISAPNYDRLDEKLQRFYPNVPVLSVKVIGA